MLGLYLHIPFCSSICSYCNFNRGLFDVPLKARYVDALEREIAAAAEERAADSIFLGGGTPSLLEPADVARLLRTCRDAFPVAPGAEITLETNPETATPERLTAFLEAGVNRISFGVQSFQDDELQRLGRVHSAARASEAIRAARSAGFANLSFDLMCWLPGQTRASWRDTVDRAIEHAPDHLSLYLLELYPNAPLKDAMARVAASARPSSPESVAWAQAADDDAADMYLEGLERLDAAGFEQYEISNVARPGLLSRHNVKYWQEGDWRGFGCAAHSTVDGARWHNVAATIEYIEAVERGGDVARGRHVLTPSQRFSEGLFTGLRLTRGVDRRNFLARHGVDPWTQFGDSLTDYRDAGLVWEEGFRFGLTRRGMLLANEILATFV